MSRYFLRIAIAILCFSIGLFGAWASGYWKSFEDFIVDRFSKEETIKFMLTDYGYEIPVSFTYEKDEKEVYQATFQELFGYPGLDSLFVSEITNSKRNCQDEPELDCTSFAPPSAEMLEGVEGETYKDYSLKNRNLYKIDSLPDLPFRAYIRREEPLPFLYTEEELTSWFKKDLKFYEGHPNSTFASISRVGFNPRRTQAFVYVHRHGGIHFWATGSFILLKKVGGVWKVEKEIHLYYFCGG